MKLQACLEYNLSVVFFVVAKTRKQQDQNQFEAKLKYEAEELSEYQIDMEGDVDVCNKWLLDWFFNEMFSKEIWEMLVEETNT